jgi:hypothetical protein
MELSSKTKITMLVIVLTVFILGTTMYGPKFINKIQMQFGFKGKVDLIEQCLATTGCAISADELDLLTKYRLLEKSELGVKLKNSELGKSLKEEEEKVRK